MLICVVTTISMIVYVCGGKCTNMHGGDDDINDSCVVK